MVAVTERPGLTLPPTANLGPRRRPLLMFLIIAVTAVGVVVSSWILDKRDLTTAATVFGKCAAASTSAAKLPNPAHFGSKKVTSPKAGVTVYKWSAVPKADANAYPKVLSASNGLLIIGGDKTAGTICTTDRGNATASIAYSTSRTVADLTLTVTDVNE